VKLTLRSNILKLALFATGLSGIVAEYILATLASFFISDSATQWTLIISTMLFSMGLGSRLSKYIEKNLLQKFIMIEFLLSILTAYSSLIAYTASAYTIYTGAIIYGLAIIIGLLIGMEIPMVMRLNQAFEELKVNVSGILEQDYYGSLAGGLFFAFVGLPILGLTYTPFVLGFVNFSVAIILYFILYPKLIGGTRVGLNAFTGGILALLVAGFFLAKPIIFYGEQRRYKDKIIYEEQSRYQKIVITQWKDNYWLYINHNQQLSSIDEVLYHEPLVHPALSLLTMPQDVLVLGGGDGCAVREILKYPSVKNITLVDLDPAMTKLGREHPVLVNINEDALNNDKVTIIHQDGFNFIANHDDYYDAIIIDLPDPKSIDLGRLYSYEFYQMVKRRLRPYGVVITQAGSPYYATKAFLCIDKTLSAAGFNTVPLHNQIVTMGEWGWIIGIKDERKTSLKTALQSLEFGQVPTRWINNEAMQLMTSFGKTIYTIPVDSVQINKIHNPVLYRYYLQGNWDLY
jgi:spermidine synthase